MAKSKALEVTCVFCGQATFTSDGILVGHNKPVPGHVRCDGQLRPNAFQKGGLIFENMARRILGGGNEDEVMDTARFDKALEGRSGETWREIRRRFGYCDTCLQSALPGLNHCGKCLSAVIEPEPLKAEVLSMQLPQEMDLRDWFAGQALIGYATRVRIGLRSEEAATECYEMADAMLAAREVISSVEEPAPQEGTTDHDVLKATDFGGI